MTVRTRELAIAGQKRRIQCFGEGDVGCIVRGDGFSQFPDPREQVVVWGPFYEHGRVVAECFFGTGRGDFFELGEAP